MYCHTAVTIILCYFRLPGTAHCQLPSGAAIKWPQEPLATAQRGQAGRSRNTPTWLGPLRLITPWGNRNMLLGGQGSPLGRGAACSPCDLATEARRMSCQDRDAFTSGTPPTPPPHAQSGACLVVRSDSSEPSGDCPVPRSGKNSQPCFCWDERGHSQGPQPRPGQDPGTQMSWKYL